MKAVGGWARRAHLPDRGAGDRRCGRGAGFHPGWGVDHRV